MCARIWLLSWQHDETRRLLFIYHSLRAGQPVGKADDPDTISEPTKLNLALLDRIRKTCVERDIGFFIVEVPRNLKPGSYVSNFPYDAMRKSGYVFDVVSPLSLFERNHTSNGGSLIYWQRSAGHWTPSGTAAVTEAIVDHIKTLK